jgi:hypothetical protein
VTATAFQYYNIGLKFHIPEGQKTCQTANFYSMNGLACQDAELKAEKYGGENL